MFGEGGGWGIPTLWNTLVVTVGGVGAKPGMGNGQRTERECLNLTTSADHDVVDGAALAAFASSRREHIESSEGLNWLRSVRQGSMPPERLLRPLKPMHSAHAYRRMNQRLAEMCRDAGML
jgi:hypothetical protein